MSFSNITYIFNKFFDYRLTIYRPLAHRTIVIILASRASGHHLETKPLKKSPVNPCETILKTLPTNPWCKIVIANWPKSTWYNKYKFIKRVNNAAQGNFRPKHTNTKIFENHLNPAMLVFIVKALVEYSQLSTNVPGFQLFFSFFA